MSFANFRLKTKLLLLAAAGLIASLAIAAAAYCGLMSARNTENFLAQNAVPGLQLISDIAAEASKLRESQLNLVLIRAPRDWLPTMAKVVSTITPAMPMRRRQSADCWRR